MIILNWDNAFPKELFDNIKQELLWIDSTSQWTKLFKRAGSEMYEANDRNLFPILNYLYTLTSTSNFISMIEKKLEMKGIIPDPHMIGSGYSKIVNHGDLKPHIDFNWNDKLKLYRAASLIYYLSTPSKGGELEFENTITIEAKENTAVLFQHSEQIRHFVRPVDGVRYAVRFFYYTSNLAPPPGYHRSLYGFKDGIPADVSG